MWPRGKRSSDGNDILFFTRGRGRGHAIPHIVIVEDLKRLHLTSEVCFVSYGTGAATLVERGFSVVDLDLQEDNPFLETLVCVTQLIAERRPKIVVSHEEFAALPAAKAFGIPTVFLTDWFVPIDNLWMQTLKYADEIIFMEERGIFPEPAYAKGRVKYVGPMIRHMVHDKADRIQSREDLKLSQRAKVISIIPGSWATEERAPILDLVLPAFENLGTEEKVLVWVAGRDYKMLSDRLRLAKDVIVKKEHWPIEQLMVASDLVITKGNRGTTCELGTLGVPSISVSFGLNPIDDIITPRIRTNVALHAKGIDSGFLGELMRRLLFDRLPLDLGEGHPPGAGAVAQALGKFIAR